MMYADTTSVITATSGMILAVGVLLTAWASFRNGKKVTVVDTKVDAVHVIAADVQQQVTTINGRTIAQLSDDTETRRIERILPVDRTTAEKEHVSAVPPHEGPHIA